MTIREKKRFTAWDGQRRKREEGLLGGYCSHTGARLVAWPNVKSVEVVKNGQSLVGFERKANIFPDGLHVGCVKGKERSTIIPGLWLHKGKEGVATHRDKESGR